VRAPNASLDRDILSRYNGGKQTAHSQLSAGLSVSIVMDSTLIQRHAAFKVHGDTGPANVILSLLLAHAVLSAPVPCTSEKPLQRSYSHA